MFLSTTLLLRCPFFVEILELWLDARKLWATSGSDLSPPTLAPGPGAHAHCPLRLRGLPWKSLRCCSFHSGERERSSQSSLLILSTKIEHWPSCFQDSFPVSESCAAGTSAYVPCALCSWNRIWTRYSSIWKKWGSLTCLASAKQQEHGNASCATTLKKQPVRDTPLLLRIICAPGIDRIYEPHCSCWPSSCINILSCNNAQKCAWLPLLRAEKDISPKWEWEKEMLKGRDTYTRNEQEKQYLT